MPTQHEIVELGAVKYQPIKHNIRNIKKTGYTKFTDKERFLIGKYAAINGPIAAVRKFKTSHPHLDFGESQARALRKKYLANQKSANVEKKIVPLKRGRPLMLGTVDEKVQVFLQLLRRKGEVVNTVVAIATAKALIERSGLENLKAIDLESSFWAKSLFQRMGFVRRGKTTSKPEIPERGKHEANSSNRESGGKT